MEDAQNGPGLGVLAIIALVVMVMCLIISLLVGGTVLLYGVISTGNTVEVNDDDGAIEVEGAAESASEEAIEDAADEGANSEGGSGEEASEGEESGEEGESGGEETGSLYDLQVVLV